MLRNSFISMVTLAILSQASTTVAFAWGESGGHGAGGFHGEEAFSFHAGGFRGGGFRGRGFGFFGPYVSCDYPYYGGDYEDGCYLAIRPILTRHGWRSRRVEMRD
jgi:hypothetical protein